MSGPADKGEGRVVPLPGTPLPWALDAEWSGELHGSDGTVIALLLGSEQSFQTFTIDPTKARLGHSPERHANAAYIVRACNAFPELVEALEEARTFIDAEPALNDHSCPGASCARCKRRLEAFTKVNSVLAKSRGQS
jgi:hypothetical protein